MSFLIKLSNKFKNDTVKNILVLLTGSALAQLFPILVSPVLTRIYSPKDFGLLSLFVSISTLLVVFASGRLDLAIVEPKNEEESKVLAILSKRINIVFNLFLFIIICLFEDVILSYLNEKNFSRIIYLIPINVFILTNISILNNWFIRTKRFNLLSLSRIINSFINVLLSISLAYVFNIKGLILGYFIGQIIGFIFLEFNSKLKSNKDLGTYKFYNTFKKFKSYTYFLIPATLLSELSLSLPIILLTKFFDIQYAGLFSFAYRITMLPSSFLGNAIGEVYRQRSFEEYINFGNCKTLYLKTFKKLFFLGIIPLIVLLFYSKFLFVFCFGTEWLKSGEISQYLSILVFFNMISVPLSSTILLNRSQHIDLFLQIFRVIITLVSFYIGYIYSKDFMLALKIYVVGFSIFYILHSLIQYRAASGHKANILIWKN